MGKAQVTDDVFNRPPDPKLLIAGKVRCAVSILVTICNRRFQATGPPKLRLGLVPRPALVQCLYLAMGPYTQPDLLCT